METLFVFMVAIYIAYHYLILKTFGVPDSLSETYYLLPGPYKLLFTVFCWAFGLISVIIGLELSDGGGLFFLAGSGLVLVGAATQFKEDSVEPLHILGAAIAIVFSGLAIALYFNLWWLLIVEILLTGIVFWLSRNNNSVFWYEQIYFVGILIAFGTQLF